MKVFLDIDIGNRAAFERDLAVYAHTESFFHRAGSQVYGTHRHDVFCSRPMNFTFSVCAQFGLRGRLDELDLDSIEVLKEAFDSDPTWSTKVHLLECVSIAQEPITQGVTI